MVQKGHILHGQSNCISMDPKPSQSLQAIRVSKVGEIQNNSDPSQWKHIPGIHNAADNVSRGITMQELNGRWKHGPEFLQLLEEKWPQEPEPFVDDLQETKEERRNAKIVCTVTLAKVEEAIPPKRFSNWKNLSGLLLAQEDFVKK